MRALHPLRTGQESAQVTHTFCNARVRSHSEISIVERLHWELTCYKEMREYIYLIDSKM